MQIENALSQLSEVVAAFKNIHTNSAELIHYQSPNALAKVFDLGLGNEHSSNELTNSILSYIHWSVKTGNPQFLNQLFAGFNSPAVLGDLIATLMNTSMYTYEVAPLATLMELEVIRKMNSYTGFTQGGGILTTGGSNSNLIALLAARQHFFPNIKNDGINQANRLCLFTSEDAHYSFDKAAAILGIGMSAVIKVQTDENGCMLPDALQVAINQSRANGLTPFFVCATAGTTELGAFDPFEDIAAIAKKEQLWFHIDGSWGGPLIMSSKGKELFKGVQLADSFAWNPHKLMNVPLVCAALLFKDEKHLAVANSTPNADYIFHEHEDDYFDLGNRSMQCGRRNDALKIWTAWRFYGDEGYQKRLDNCLDLAQYAANKIIATPGLELLTPLHTLNVNFRYLPKHSADINEFNLKVRNQLIRLGKSMVNFCYLNNILSIRLVLVNGELSSKDVDTFFTNFMEVAQNIENESTLVSKNTKI